MLTASGLETVRRTGLPAQLCPGTVSRYPVEILILRHGCEISSHYPLLFSRGSRSCRIVSILILLF
jgi:hypothetical protein